MNAFDRLIFNLKPTQYFSKKYRVVFIQIAQFWVSFLTTKCQLNFLYKLHNTNLIFQQQNNYWVGLLTMKYYCTSCTILNWFSAIKYRVDILITKYWVDFLHKSHNADSLFRQQILSWFLATKCQLSFDNLIDGWEGNEAMRPPNSCTH